MGIRLLTILWVFVVTALPGPGAADEGELSWQPVSGPWGEEPVLGLAEDTSGRVVAIAAWGLWRLEADGWRRDPRYDPPDLDLRTHVGTQPVAVIPPGSDDVWIADSSGLLRWRDGEWEAWPTRSVSPQLLSFVGPDDGWAGGGFGYFYRWDGRAWTVVSDPALPTGVGYFSRLVVATAADEVWLAGDGGVGLVRWDGTSFRRVRSLASGGRPQVGSKGCVLPSGEVVLASDPNLLVRGDEILELGTRWVTTCAVDGQGRAWLAGEAGRLAVLDDDGALREVPSPTYGDIKGLFFDSQGRGWITDGDGLYRSQPPDLPVFRERGAAAGVADAGHGIAALFVHHDADAHPDLLLVNEPGELRLLRNGGDWNFIDVTEAAGLAHRSWSKAHVRACDLDLDGDSELLVLDHPPGGRVLRYLRNVRGRYEEEEILRPDLHEAGRIGNGDLACVDLDADGDLDVYLTQMDGWKGHPQPNIVLENVGWGRLERRAVASRGLGGGPDCSYVPVFLDLRGDARPELLSLNLWGQGHTAWTRGDDGRWHELTDRLGMAASYSHVVAAATADLDGDGDRDLFVSENRGRSRFYRNDGGRLTQVVGHAAYPLRSAAGQNSLPSSVFAGDLDADGDQDLLTLDAGTRFQVLLNQGELRFRDVSGDLGFDRRDLDNLAAGDVDLDGDLDLYLVLSDGPNELHEDVSGGGDRVARLSAREASTARARVELLDASGRTLATRWSLQDGSPVTLPARAAPGETLRVTLSDGSVRRVPAPAPGQHEVRLESGLVAAWRAARAFVGRRLAWLDRREEGGKSALFLGALALAVILGRRRRTLWFGARALPVALLVGWAGLTLVLVEARPAVRWAGAGLGLSLIPALVLLDLRATRLRRATWISHFRIERSLGAGGMGAVHLAWDTVHGRRVALKVMHPQLNRSASALERFHREAQLAARFRHPNLVEVFEYGECQVFEGDQPVRTRFLSMEYVDGASLRTWFEQSGPLPLGTACRIGVELLEALQVLHDGDVIHRDLKPENVLLTEAGSVKIADFGLARGGGVQTVTATGDVFGTIAYMAPEQARTSQVDARADLYAVGVTLYELLCGRRPFDDEDPIRLTWLILNGDPPPLDQVREGVPVPVRDAIHRALRRDPEERWHRAEDIAAVLRPFADHRSDTRSLRRISRMSGPGPVDLAAGLPDRPAAGGAPVEGEQPAAFGDEETRLPVSGDEETRLPPDGEGADDG